MVRSDSTPYRSQPITKMAPSLPSMGILRQHQSRRHSSSTSSKNDQATLKDKNKKPSNKKAKSTNDLYVIPESRKHGTADDNNSTATGNTAELSSAHSPTQKDEKKKEKSSNSSRKASGGGKNSSRGRGRRNSKRSIGSEQQGEDGSGAVDDIYPPTLPALLDNDNGNGTTNSNTDDHVEFLDLKEPAPDSAMDVQENDDDEYYVMAEEYEHEIQRVKKLNATLTANVATLTAAALDGSGSNHHNRRASTTSEPTVQVEQCQSLGTESSMGGSFASIETSNAGNTTPKSTLKKQTSSSSSKPISMDLTPNEQYTPAPATTNSDIYNDMILTEEHYLHQITKLQKLNNKLQRKLENKKKLIAQLSMNLKTAAEKIGEVGREKEGYKSQLEDMEEDNLGQKEEQKVQKEQRQIRNYQTQVLENELSSLLQIMEQNSQLHARDRQELLNEYRSDDANVWNRRMEKPEDIMQRVIRNLRWGDDSSPGADDGDEDESMGGEGFDNTNSRDDNVAKGGVNIWDSVTSLFGGPQQKQQKKEKVMEDEDEQPLVQNVKSFDVNAPRKAPPGSFGDSDDGSSSSDDESSSSSSSSSGSSSDDDDDDSSSTASSEEEENEVAEEDTASVEDERPAVTPNVDESCNVEGTLVKETAVAAPLTARARGRSLKIDQAPVLGTVTGEGAAKESLSAVPAVDDEEEAEVKTSPATPVAAAASTPKASNLKNENADSTEEGLVDDNSSPDSAIGEVGGDDCDSMSNGRGFNVRGIVTSLFGRPDREQEEQQHHQNEEIQVDANEHDLFKEIEVKTPPMPCDNSGGISTSSSVRSSVKDESSGSDESNGESIIDEKECLPDMHEAVADEPSLLSNEDESACHSMMSKGHQNDKLHHSVESGSLGLPQSQHEDYQLMELSPADETTHDDDIAILPEEDATPELPVPLIHAEEAKDSVISNNDIGPDHQLQIPPDDTTPDDDGIASLPQDDDAQELSTLLNDAGEAQDSAILDNDDEFDDQLQKHHDILASNSQDSLFEEDNKSCFKDIASDGGEEGDRDLDLDKCLANEEYVETEEEEESACPKPPVSEHQQEEPDPILVSNSQDLLFEQVNASRGMAKEENLGGCTKEEDVSVAAASAAHSLKENALASPPVFEEDLAFENDHDCYGKESLCDNKEEGESTPKQHVVSAHEQQQESHHILVSNSQDSCEQENVSSSRELNTLKVITSQDTTTIQRQESASTTDNCQNHEDEDSDSSASGASTPKMGSSGERNNPFADLLSLRQDHKYVHDHKEDVLEHEQQHEPHQILMSKSQDSFEEENIRSARECVVDDNRGMVGENNFAGSAKHEEEESVTGCGITSEAAESAANSLEKHKLVSDLVVEKDVDGDDCCDEESLYETKEEVAEDHHHWSKPLEQAVNTCSSEDKEEEMDSLIANDDVNSELARDPPMQVDDDLISNEVEEEQKVYSCMGDIVLDDGNDKTFTAITDPQTDKPVDDCLFKVKRSKDGILLQQTLHEDHGEDCILMEDRSSNGKYFVGVADAESCDGSSADGKESIDEHLTGDEDSDDDIDEPDAVIGKHHIVNTGQAEPNDDDGGGHSKEFEEDESVYVSIEPAPPVDEISVARVQNEIADDVAREESKEDKPESHVFAVAPNEDDSSKQSVGSSSTKSFIVEEEPTRNLSEEGLECSVVQSGPNGNIFDIKEDDVNRGEDDLDLDLYDGSVEKEAASADDENGLIDEASQMNGIEPSTVCYGEKISDFDEEENASFIALEEVENSHSDVDDASNDAMTEQSAIAPQPIGSSFSPADLAIPPFRGRLEAFSQPPESVAGEDEAGCKSSFSVQLVEEPSVDYTEKGVEYAARETKDGDYSNNREQELFKHLSGEEMIDDSDTDDGYYISHYISREAKESDSRSQVLAIVDDDSEDCFYNPREGKDSHGDFPVDESNDEGDEPSGLVVMKLDESRSCISMESSQQLLGEIDDSCMSMEEGAARATDATRAEGHAQTNHNYVTSQKEKQDEDKIPDEETMTLKQASTSDQQHNGITSTSDDCGATSPNNKLAGSSYKELALATSTELPPHEGGIPSSIKVGASVRTGSPTGTIVSSLTAITAGTQARNSSALESKYISASKTLADTLELIKEQSKARLDGDDSDEEACKSMTYYQNVVSQYTSGSSTTKRKSKDEVLSNRLPRRELFQRRGSSSADLFVDIVSDILHKPEDRQVLVTSRDIDKYMVPRYNPPMLPPATKRRGSSSGVPTFTKGQKEDGFFMYKSSSGNEYSGHWKGGRRHGYGTAKYRDGEVFHGEWRRGRRHGHGVLHLANSEVFDGYWFSNKKHGLGIYYWNDGEVDVSWYIEDAREESVRWTKDRRRAFLLVLDSEKKEQISLVKAASIVRDWERRGETYEC